MVSEDCLPTANLRIILNHNRACIPSVYLRALCGEIFMKKFTIESMEVHRGVLRMGGAEASELTERPSPSDTGREARTTRHLLVKLQGEAPS